MSSYGINHELRTEASRRYEHDASGNRVGVYEGSERVQRYEYGLNNRLKRVRGSGDAIEAEYYYDPFGRLLWKTYSEDGAARTEYWVYSDEGYAGRFILSGLPQSQEAAPTRYEELWIWNMQGVWSTDAVAVKTVNGWRWMQNDHLGTPQQLLNPEGAVVHR